jgi:predicted acylesterase/phospholipase RssA
MRSVTVALGALVSVVALLSAGAVFAMFVWAAKKDGEKDRALQRRLGIHRRTRIGR